MGFAVSDQGSVDGFAVFLRDFGPVVMGRVDGLVLVLAHAFGDVHGVPVALEVLAQLHMTAMMMMVMWW